MYMLVFQSIIGSWKLAALCSWVRHAATAATAEQEQDKKHATISKRMKIVLMTYCTLFFDTFFTVTNIF
jgi:hypothetical protein